MVSSFLRIFDSEFSDIILDKFLFYPGITSLQDDWVEKIIYFTIG